MLYRVQKRDITKVGKVLADAFQHDPVWLELYKGESHSEEKFAANFETGVRLCYAYGEVYAPSEALEGVIAWVPGKYADMNMWRVIRSGALGSAMRMGMNIARKMRPVFKQIVVDRHKHMAGTDYLYIMMLGVTTRLQGQGFGRKLLDAAIDKSERERLHLYLETETEENVKMYEHFGFRLLDRITLPVIELPMWEMVREPKA